MSVCALMWCIEPIGESLAPSEAVACCWSNKTALLLICQPARVKEAARGCRRHARREALLCCSLIGVFSLCMHIVAFLCCTAYDTRVPSCASLRGRLTFSERTYSSFDTLACYFLLLKSSVCPSTADSPYPEHALLKTHVILAKPCMVGLLRCDAW